MVAIVTGTGLGLFNSSRAVLGEQGSIGNATLGQGNESIYVNAATGNLVIQQTDEMLFGSGLDLNLVRTYNSQGLMNDDNGDNWRLSASVRLTDIPTITNSPNQLTHAGSYVTRVGEDGAEIRYTYDATRGVYLSTDGNGAHDFLTVNFGDLSWTRIDGSSRVTEQYNSTGQLTSTKDIDGNTTTYTYNASGMLVQISSLTQDATGTTTTQSQSTYIDYHFGTNNIMMLRTISANGTQIRTAYTYDSQNRLSQVIVDLTPTVFLFPTPDINGDGLFEAVNGETYVTTYTYDGDSKRVASITQSDGTTISFSYELIPSTTQYRIKTMTDGAGNLTTFNYNINNTQTDVIAMGLTTTYIYDGAKRLTEIRTPAVNGAPIVTRYSYDTDGNVLTVTDGRNLVTTHQYDANGNVVLSRDAAGNTVARAYNRANQITSETRYTTPSSGVPANPLTTRYVYDAENHLRFLISAEGRVTEYTYNTVGQRISEIQYTGGTYNVAALKDRLASLDFDGINDAVTYTNPNLGTGPISITTWINADQLTGGDDYYGGRGIIRNANNEAAGDYYLSVDSMGRVHFAYWSTPDVTGNDTTGRVYVDLGNAANTLITAGKWYQITATVNYMNGNAVRKIYINGVEQTLAAPAATEGGWGVENAIGRSWVDPTFSFDGKIDDVRLYTGVLSNAEITSLYGNDNATITNGTLRARWAFDQTTGTTATNTVSATLNGTLNNITAGQEWRIGVTTALTETDLNTWTGTQNKTSIIRTDYGYDFRGLLNTATQFNSVNATTGAGITTDVNNSVTRYVYDQRGQLLQRIDPRGELTTTNPNDYITSFVYDGLGRLLSSTDAQGYITTQQYDAVQNRIVTTSANGTTTTSVYNARGLLISQTQASGDTTLGTTHFSYDALGRLRMVTDPTGVKSYVVYDEANRKVAEVDGSGAMIEYLYNADNQVWKTIRYANRMTSTQLANLSALDQNNFVTNTQLSTLRPVVDNNFADNNTADHITWTIYDTAGRVVWTVESNDTESTTGFATRYFYDGAHRLTATAVYGTAVSTTAISATSTGLTTPTGALRTTRYFYSNDGLLVGTLNADNFLTEQKYNTAGQLIETILYNTAKGGTTLSAARPVLHNDDLHTYNLYNSKGQLAGVLELGAAAIGTTLNAEYFLTEYQYDVAGNVVQQIRYNDKSPITTYTGQSLSALKPTTNSSKNRITITTYNANNQVMTVTQNPSGTVTRYSYDNMGRLIRTDAALNTADLRTTRIQYDAFGRVTAELTGEGSAALDALINPTQNDIDNVWNQYGIRHVYDAAGRRTQTIDQNGYKTFYYYDEANRLRYTIRQADNGTLINQGEITEREYDAIGQHTYTRRYATRISLNGLTGGVLNATTQNQFTSLRSTIYDRVDETRYTLRGAVKEAIDALGKATSYTYTGFGELSTQRTGLSDTQSLMQTYGYNNRGMLISVNRYDQRNYSYDGRSYDAFGRLKSVTDANNHTTNFTYDRLGRQISVTDPLTNKHSTTYDAFGRVLTQTDALNHTTTYEYDDTNRSISITTAEGIKTTTVKNRLGETVSVTDARGNTSTYTYNKDGQLKTETDALNHSTTHNYDRAGREYETIDANGHIIAYAYDAVNRLITRTVDPTGLNLITRYEYDAIGNTVKMTDANNVITQTEYDAKGQVKAVIVDAAVGGLNLRTEYTYDDVGHTLTVTEGAQTSEARVTEYQYDVMGRRVKEIRDPNGLQLTTEYRYDKKDNVTLKIEAQGTADERITNYIYDNNDRLLMTVDPMGVVTENIYDANGNVIKTIHHANAIALNNTLAYDNGNSYVYNAATNQINMVAGGRSIRIDPAILGGTAEYGYLNGSIGGVGFSMLQITNGTANNWLGDLNINVLTAASGTYEVGAWINSSIVGNSQFLLTVTLDASQNMTRVLFQPTEAFIRQLLVEDAVNDQVTRYTYDQDNRLTYSVDAMGAVTERTYDGNGNVIQTQAYATALTDAQLTALDTDSNTLTWLRDNVVSTATDQINRAVYDTANRQTFSIDALGYVTEKVYDNVGNVKETIRYANAVPVQNNIEINNLEGYTYAPATNLFTAGAGRSIILQPGAYIDLTPIYIGVTFYRNGEIVSTTNPMPLDFDAAQNWNGSVTLPTLAAGNYHAEILVANSSIEGRTTSYNITVDANGKITRVQYAPRLDEIRQQLVASTTQDQSTKVIYDNANRARFQIDAMGYVTENAYDARGNIIKITRYNDAITSTAVTATISDVQTSLQARTAPTTANDQISRFVYDKAGYLAYSIDAMGAITKNTYDSVGNVIQKREYSTALTGAQLTILDNVADRKAYLQTNVVADNATTSKDRVTHYAYDKNGRVLFSIDPMLAAMEQSYDAFGNIIQTRAYAAAIALNQIQIASTLASETDRSVVMKSIVVVNNATDRITQFVYNKDNKLIEQRIVDGFSDAPAFTLDALQTGPIENYFRNSARIAYDSLGNAMAVTRKQRNGVVDAVYARYYKVGIGWDATEKLLHYSVYAEYSEQVACDEQGNFMIMWRSSDPALSGLLSIRYSAQSGWESTPTTLGSQTYSPSELSFDAQGNAIAVWQGTDNVIYAKRYIVSQGWESTPAIALSAGGSGASSPKISLDSNGNAIAVWVQNDAGMNNIYSQRYTAGVGWSTQAPALLETGSGAASAPQIRFDAQGNAIAIWSQTEGSSTNLYARRYIVGQGWEIDSPVLLDNAAGNVGNAQFAIDTNGNAIVVWLQDGNLFARQYYAGQGWDEVAKPVSDAIYGNYYGSNSRGPTISFDDAGNALLIWTQYENFSDSANIYARRYIANEGWSAQSLIAARKVTGTYNYLNLGIATHGNALAIWMSDSRFVAQKINIPPPVYNYITTRFSYDAFGNQISILDARGVELTEKNTAWAKAERIRLGYAELVTNLTDAQKDELRAIYTAQQEFDKNNRKTAAIDPNGGRTQTDYDAFGNIVTLTDANGGVGSFYFNKVNQLTEQLDANSYLTRIVRDAFGNAKETIKYYNKTAGNLNVVEDTARDQHTYAVYDTLNRTRQITDAETNIEDFTYDAFGNVKTHTDKNRNVTSYDYYANGKLQKEYLPVTAVTNNTSTFVGSAIEFNTTGNADSPQVAFNKQGNGIAVWRQQQPGGSAIYDIYASRYVNGSWVASPVLINTQATTATAPKIAMDANGNAMAVWEQSGMIYTSRFNVTTGLWQTSPTAINSVASTRATSYQVAFDGNGNAMVVWSQSDGAYNRVYANRCLSTGVWQGQKTVQSNSSALPSQETLPQVVFDASGNATCIWIATTSWNFVFTSRYDVVTNLWISKEEFIDESFNFNSSATPRLSIDNQGNVLAVWTKTDGVRTSIYSASYQNGQGWQAVHVIETYDAGNASSPQVAMDAHGNAVVTWLQTEGGYNNLYANRYIVGQGWQGAELIEKQLGSASDASVAFDPQGSIVVMWRQTSINYRTSIYSNRYVTGQGWQGDEWANNTNNVYAPSFGFNADGKAVAVWAEVDGSTYYRIMAKQKMDTATLAQVTNRYEYNAFGEKSKDILAEGFAEQRVTEYRYNNNGQLIETIAPQVRVETSGIEAAGAVSVVVGGASAVSYSVTSQTRSSTTQVGIGFTNTYSATLSMTWPAITGYGNGALRIVVGGDEQGVTNTGSNIKLAANSMSYAGSISFSRKQVGFFKTLEDIQAVRIRLIKETDHGDVVISEWLNSNIINQNGSTNLSTSSSRPLNSIVNFSGQPVSGKTMRVTYWSNSEPDNIKQISLESYMPGSFSGMLSEILNGGYGYTAVVFDQAGNVVNQIAGTIAVTSGMTTTTIATQAFTAATTLTPHSYKSYDAKGNVIAETDAKGQITRHYYNNLSRRIGTLDAENYLHQYFYDVVGNRIAERTYATRIPLVYSVQSTMPDVNGITGFDKNDYRETTYRYDAANHLQEKSTRAVLVYDRLTQGVSVNAPALPASNLRTQSLVDAYAYDHNGNVVMITDARGGKTYNFYDKVGNRVQQIDALGYATTWKYDGNGNVETQTRYGGAVQSSMLAILTPDSTNPPDYWLNYLEAGFPNRVTTYTYDRMNRIKTETVIDTYTSINATTGSPTEITGNIVTTFEYDAIGNRSAVIAANNGRTSYTYDALNRLTLEQGETFTDFENTANVRTTTATVYDAVGNIKAVVNKGKTAGQDQTTQYQYDAQGNLIWKRDAEGNNITFVYDLNNNMTLMNTQRTNPDGTRPVSHTRYVYDNLNRQLSTQAASYSLITANYNAYGEVISKGINGYTTEFFQYDYAGRLIKTNKDDGVWRAYLYDANGNSTAKIQSAVTDVDLSPNSVTLDLIANMSSRTVQRTENTYDAKNQLIATYEAPSHIYSGVDPTQSGWVDVRNDPFRGGLITPIAGGAVTFEPQAFVPQTWDSSGYSQVKNLKISWPTIVGYGSGSLRVDYMVTNQPSLVWGVGVNYSLRLGTDVSSTTLALESIQYSGHYYNDYAYIRLYKETAHGDILISEWDNPPSVITTGYSTQIKSQVTFTEQDARSKAMDLWVWREGEAKTQVTATQMVNKNGVMINNWFVFDWTGYSQGVYNYEFITRDAITGGTELEHVKGAFELDASPRLLSKQIYQANIDSIARTQSYNAFGEVFSETDAYGNALLISDEAWAQAERVKRGMATLAVNLTDLNRRDLLESRTTHYAYNNRGQLVDKLEPVVTYTDERGVLVRSVASAPITHYYYDVVGNHVGTRDANGNINSQRYDVAGHLINEYQGRKYSVVDGSVIVADGSIMEYGFDEFGNRRYVENNGRVLVTNEVNPRTEYTYDKNNRLIKQVRASDVTIGSNAARYDLYTYDEAGRRISHTNALGLTEYAYYDDLGRVTSNVSFGGIATRYEYAFGFNGRITKTTKQANGLSLIDIKDYFGRITYHSDLWNHATGYTYNMAGWLTQQNYYDGAYQNRITYSYYHNGKLKGVSDRTVAGTPVTPIRSSLYQYDVNGNRIQEEYMSQDGAVTTFYQQSSATYDELNRLTRITDSKYTVQYEYDAVGNRRHIYARYNEMAGVQRQDYWYTYDSMNRFVTTKGTLANTTTDAAGDPVWNRGNNIIAGSNGVIVSYDDYGNRASAAYMANGASYFEEYSYAKDGLLTETKINGVKRSQRRYDIVGNVTNYSEYKANANLSRSVNTQYFNNGNYLDGKSSYESTLVYKDVTGGISLDKITTASYIYGTGGYLAGVFSTQPGANTLTSYNYNYWDTEKQSQIKISGTTTDYVSEWAPGISNFTYDKLGHLEQVIDEKGYRKLSYKIDTEGRILQKTEVTGLLWNMTTKTQNYYYFNGISIGDAGSFGASANDYASILARYDADPSKDEIKPVSSADFDYSFQPVNDRYPATTPGTYVVPEDGITLQSIAQSMWGDSSLWYLIADANGLSNSATLVGGQTLVIPNVVTNLHNNSTTYKVYNPAEIIGDVSPTLPEPPPPPPPPDEGCGLKQVLVVVIAAVVTYVSAGAMGGSALAWAAGAMLGSAVSQVAAIQMGIQEDFSWGQVGAAGLTAWATAGLNVTGADTWYMAAGKTALSNAIGQGSNIGFNLQEEFSWSSVAASVIASPINRKINSMADGNEAAAGKFGNFASGKGGATWAGFGRDLLANVGTNFVSQAAKIVVTGDGKVDWASVGTNALGGAIGSAMNAGLQGAAYQRHAASLTDHERLQEQVAAGIFTQKEADDIERALGRSMASNDPRDPFMKDPTVMSTDTGSVGSKGSDPLMDELDSVSSIFDAMDAMSVKGEKFGLFENNDGMYRMEALSSWGKSQASIDNMDDTELAFNLAYRVQNGEKLSDQEATFMQLTMNEIGRNVGAADGVVGRNTRSAVDEWLGVSESADAGGASTRSVKAVADGTVLKIGWEKDSHTSGNGYRVQIQEDSTHIRIYGHLDPNSISVKIGDPLTSDTVFGSYADPTNGHSTGPHVHIQLMEYSVSEKKYINVNPGLESPLVGNGRITSAFEEKDSAHPNPHVGIDWKY